MTDYRQSHRASGEHYDERIAASPFDRYLAHWEARHVAAIVTRRFPEMVPRYLDFACGTGRITSVVAPLARESVGVDISSSMLAVAAAHLPAVRFVHGDLTREELPIGEFDLVTAFRFFGNAEQPLREEVLQALHHRIVPGGYLLINNHRNPRSVASLLGALRGRAIDTDLTHAKLRRTLRAAGFRIVERRPIGAWMYRAALMEAAQRPAWRERMLEWLFGARFWTPLSPDAVIVARRESPTNA